MGIVISFQAAKMARVDRESEKAARAAGLAPKHLAEFQHLVLLATSCRVEGSKGVAVTPPSDPLPLDRLKARLGDADLWTVDGLYAWEYTRLDDDAFGTVLALELENGTLLSCWFPQGARLDGMREAHCFCTALNPDSPQRIVPKAL